MDVGSFDEIEEHRATGDTATLYADLRETLRLPFVNLIWRHFATIPGALPAIWGLLKPLYGTEELKNGAAELRRNAEVPGVEALPDAIWIGAGLDGVQREEITVIVEQYNRANSINLLALLSAGIVLRGKGRGSGGGVPGDVANNDEVLRIRALPSLKSLDASTLALVEAVDSLGRLGRNNALASLYRHLSYWPPFLSLAYAALLPFDRSGSIQAAQRKLLTQANAVAHDRLLPLLRPADFTAPGESQRRALASIDDFTGTMIGRMNVMGAALKTLVS